MLLKDAFLRFFFPTIVSKVSTTSLSDANSALGSINDVSELGKTSIRKLFTITAKHEKNYERLKHDIASLQNVKSRDLWFELANLGGTLSDSRDELVLMPHQMVMFLEHKGYAVNHEQHDCLLRRLRRLSFTADQFDDLLTPVDMRSLGDA